MVLCDEKLFKIDFKVWLNFVYVDDFVVVIMCVVEGDVFLFFYNVSDGSFV